MQGRFLTMSSTACAEMPTGNDPKCCVVEKLKDLLSSNLAKKSLADADRIRVGQLRPVEIT